LLLVLAKEYDLNRNQVRELLKQYLGLELQSGEAFAGYVKIGVLVLRFVWMLF
jgi:malonyl-CoA decarboxylase